MKLRILYEDYCSACGGWDKEQMGIGHRLGCPVGTPGTLIKKEESDLPGDYFNVVIELQEVGVSSVQDFYNIIKEYGGVITAFGRLNITRHPYRVHVTFGDSSDAIPAYGELQHFKASGVDVAVHVPEQATPADAVKFKSGYVDGKFVARFGLDS